MSQTTPNSHSPVVVWIVSNEQLLAWVRNPVPASQLNSLPEFQCQVPQVTEKICNGMPDNEAGLLAKCMFIEFPFYTCVSDILHIWHKTTSHGL